MIIYSGENIRIYVFFFISRDLDGDFRCKFVNLEPIAFSFL